MARRVKVLISQEERIAAYTHAIHDLVNTIATIRQEAENAVNGVGGSSNEERLQRIIGYATGRLTTTSERLEPVYRGWRYEEKEASGGEIPGNGENKEGGLGVRD